MMKKLAVVVSALSCVVSAFAEGQSSMPNAQSVSAIFTDSQTAIGDLLTVALPVVVAVVGGGLLVWASLSLVKEIRRAFNHGCLAEDFSDEEKAELEREYGPIDW